jgi:hypothetical protein
MFPALLQGAREIHLRLAPENDAPVIAKITATDKVILDAAPADQNADQGWRQLALPTPFEGYVPVATLDKSMTIMPGTPVHYLPTAQSAQITQVEDGDRYEVVREQNNWATVRFYNLYFSDKDTETVAIDFAKSAAPESQVSPRPEPVEGALAPSESAPGSQVSALAPSGSEDQGSLRTDSASPNQPPTVEPLTIPAPRRPINPDAPISQLDPEDLPPENVVWQPAPATRSEPAAQGENDPPSRIPDPASRISNPPSRIPNPAPSIMVTPEQTQAREATQEPGPSKTPRLLTGNLVRQIEVDGPGYPIRLRSPEGRLIAFVDLSRIYLPDLDPYLNQKVYLRGEVHPLPETSEQLVILAETLRLAD